jgi:hypothetical protein
LKQIKICPDCSTEYFPHIENCADCGAQLALPEDVKRVREEKKQLQEKALDDRVKIREGDKKWIGELYHALIDAGIPCTISADAGCNKGCSADTRYLLVSKADAEKAHVRIEEYYTEVHPEVQASKELESQGKCPACGSPVGPDAQECPDCGLILLIME